MYECDDQMVSHPSHYALIPEKGVEVLDVIKAATEDLSGIEAVDTAQVIKYICRWNKKNGKQDIKKAIYYATDLLEVLEKKESAK